LEVDTVLKLLAIVTGLIIIITRSGGLLAPATIKKVTREFASSAGSKRLETELDSRKLIIRVMGILALVMSFLLFIALGDDWSGARFVMAIVGALWLAGGLFLTLLPTQYTKLTLWFVRLSDHTIRIVCAMGVAAGVFILILGIAYY